VTARLTIVVSSAVKSRVTSDSFWLLTMADGTIDLLHVY